VIRRGKWIQVSKWGSAFLGLLIILAFLSGGPFAAHAEPRHGIAMHGEPALPPEFTHLPYANPQAPKGGVLRIATTGSFDSTNPFIVMGQPVNGVRSYTFESLLGRNADEAFSLYGLLAQTIDVSPDFASVTFRLRPEARFSDGKSVTTAAWLSRSKFCAITDGRISPTPILK
jgi:peptide/nickel transport system substrate-binding protein